MDNSSQRLYSLRIARLTITVCLASDVSGRVCLLFLQTEDQDWRLDVLEPSELLRCSVPLWRLTVVPDVWAVLWLPLVAAQWGTILTVLKMILFLLVVILPWRASQRGLLSAELLAAASAAACPGSSW